MQVSKTGIIDGNREEARHMTFDKPVVFQYINHNEVMYYEAFSLEVN